MSQVVIDTQIKKFQSRPNHDRFCIVGVQSKVFSMALGDGADIPTGSQTGPRRTRKFYTFILSLLPKRRKRIKKRYSLPNILEPLHEMNRLTFGGNVLAPLANPKQILDIGTGLGTYSGF
jgi:hypothetical protein